MKSRRNHYALVKVVDVKHKGVDDRDEVTIEFKILGKEPVELPPPAPSPALTAVLPVEIVLPSKPAEGDTTASPPPASYPFKAFLDYIKVPVEEEPITESVKAIERLAMILNDMPPPVRFVLTEIVKRSAVRSHSRYPMAAICREIELALNIDSGELKEYAAILERYRLVIVDEDEEDGLWKIYLRWWPTDWNIWDDMRRFCAKTKQSISKLIGENRFDLLN